MEQRVIVHPRVCERHPELSAGDVEHAWRYAAAARMRDFGSPTHILAVGADLGGRMIEMAGAVTEDGSVLVYHAMKLTSKAARELRLE